MGKELSPVTRHSLLDMVQAHIYVHGRVQGVSFRYYVRKRAAALALKGYVRNLADGRVEILARGSRERLDSLIGYAKNNPGLSYVVKLDIDWEEPLGDLDDFHIRF
jgi:acylphosphatase